MQTIAELIWNGRPLTESLLIPLVASYEDWKTHSGQVVTPEPAPTPTGESSVPSLMHGLPARGQTVGFVMDDDQHQVVAAVFDPGQWTDAEAKAWLDAAERAAVTQAVAPHGSAGTLANATPEYLRALIVRLRAKVSAEEYQAAVRAARASAGGQLKGKHGEQEGEQEGETEDDLKEGDHGQERGTGAAGEALHGGQNEPGVRGGRGAGDADGSEDGRDAEGQLGAEPQHPEGTAGREVPEGAVQQGGQVRQHAAVAPTQHIAMVVANMPDSTDEPIRPYVEAMEIDGETREVVWRPISRVGTVYNPLTGRPARITREILQTVHETFGKVYEFVDVPVGHHWDNPLVNTGFVRGLRLDKGGTRLWGAFDFTEPGVKEKVLHKTIAGVSIWIDPDVHDPHTGKTYPWALKHVCLTHTPLMTRLGSFAVEGRSAQFFTIKELAMGDQPNQKEARTFKAAAFAQGQTVVVDTPHDMAASGEVYFIGKSEAGVNVYSLLTSQGDELMWFLESELKDAAGAAPQAGGQGQQGAGGTGGAQSQGQAVKISDAELEQLLKARGFSIAEFKAMQRDLTVQRDANRKTRRESLAYALEGRIELDGVTQIDGYAHYPAVITAVLKAFDEMPQAAKFAVASDGTCDLDPKILEIVNAIPAEGRVKLEDIAPLPRRQARVHATKQEREAGGPETPLTKDDLIAFDADVRSGKR